MQLLVLLDVILGVFFVFLIFSLITSAINEAIAAALSSRAKWLHKGVRSLFGEQDKGSSHVNAFYQSPFISYLNDKASALHRGVSYLPAGAAYRAFVTHVAGTPEPATPIDEAMPLLLSRFPSTMLGIGDAISALPEGSELRKVLEALHQQAGADASKFHAGLKTALASITNDDAVQSAKAVVALVTQLTVHVPDSWQALKARVQELPPGSPIRAVFEDIMRTADGKLEVVERKFETWYKGFESQVSAWYRQKTHLVLAVVGFFVALVMNVDSLDLMRQLSTNDKLRDSVVAQAVAQMESGKVQTSEGKARDEAFAAYRFAQAKADRSDAVSSAAALKEAGQLWVAYLDKQKKSEESLLAKVKAMESAGLQFGWTMKFWDDLAKLDWEARLLVITQKLAGLMLTAAALTLGAPFWFDMLQKVAQVRSVGRSLTEREAQPRKK